MDPNNQPIPFQPGGNPAIPHSLPPDYLRWLFVCEFDDGTQYSQPPEDVAEVDNSKDSMYDILYWTGKLEEKPEQIKTITRFHLTDTRNWFTVDLRDGKFEVNGLPFDAKPQLTDITGPLTLIYYRETRNDLYSDGSEHQYVNRYFLGWWFIDKDGKKVEETIAIA